MATKAEEKPFKSTAVAVTHETQPTDSIKPPLLVNVLAAKF